MYVYECKSTKTSVRSLAASPSAPLRRTLIAPKLRPGRMITPILPSRPGLRIRRAFTVLALTWRFVLLRRRVSRLLLLLLLLLRLERHLREIGRAHV